MGGNGMKPNIIVVMTDQQRADFRKGAGYALDTMPFLDEWSQGGVDFARAYTPGPTCMPARVSMFTGRYPECHKARTNHNQADALYTEDLLDVMKRQGYATALCGKNHSHRKDSDFDFFETNMHGGHGGNRKNSGQEEVFADFLDARNHMESHAPSPGGVQVQHPYRNVTSALKFIDARSGDQPFFLWLSFAEPHNPYQVPEPYFDMFPPETLPELTTSTADLVRKGEKFAWLRDVWEQKMPDGIEKRILRTRSNYHGMLRLIDDQFKRLIGALEERGLSEDTLVVFLSDHGDFAGEYGLIRKGPDLPEVLTRIPMVWRGPGVSAQGRIQDGCVNLVDILSTFCDILDIPAPFGAQGKSILPLLAGQDIPAHEYDVAYSESGFSGLHWNKNDLLDLTNEGAFGIQVTFDCLNSWTQCGQVRMVRKGDYKLQLDMMGTGYLYNLAEDPLEVVNLWDRPECLQTKADMLTELAAAILKACDPLPAPHGRYRTKIHPKGYWHQEFVAEDSGVRKLPALSELKH
jgi:arylsulfatase A-like enzyme